MRRLLTAAAIATVTAFGAIAQTADKSPADQDPAGRGASTGESGASGPAVQNILTSGQARQHLQHLGYTDVSELAKDESGKWIGRATKDGKVVVVAVDIKGEVNHK